MLLLLLLYPFATMFCVRLTLVHNHSVGHHENYAIEMENSVLRFFLHFLCHCRSTVRRCETAHVVTPWIFIVAYASIRLRACACNMHEHGSNFDPCVDLFLRTLFVIFFFHVLFIRSRRHKIYGFLFVFVFVDLHSLTRPTEILMISV